MNNIIKVDKVNSVLSKVADNMSITFRTIDDKALTEINNWMPEVSRGVACFSKQNSQTTSSLMTLNMVDSGPYRVLRQILAQAEKKKNALTEIYYKTEKKKLRVKKLLQRLESAEGIEAEEIELDLNKISCDISNSQPVIEAAIKELGALKRRYEEVCRNNNIPEQWDEEDFENAEIEHHIKSMFRNAIRDRMQGTHNQGTMEYMEQFGINPITAYSLVDEYINKVRISKGADITSHYKFYDLMYNIFKEEYKKALDRLGLNNITQADFLMKENK